MIKLISIKIIYTVILLSIYIVMKLTLLNLLIEKLIIFLEGIYFAGWANVCLSVCLSIFSPSLSHLFLPIVGYQSGQLSAVLSSVFNLAPISSGLCMIDREAHLSVV